MTSTSTSASASFYTVFQSLKSDITHALNNQDVKKASSSLIDLKNQLRSINQDLPAYDQRSYESQIRELETRLSALRPKTSKFSFTSSSKPKPKPQAGSMSTSTTATTPGTGNITRQSNGPNWSGTGTVSSESSNMANKQIEAIRIENLSMKRVSLPSSSSSSSNRVSISNPDLSRSSSTTTTTVILTNLNNCIIDLRPHSSDQPGGITSLHINNLERCILFAPLEGSILLHSIAECLLVISSHQFRMHESRDTNVLMSIPSMPIIEHSTNIGFGPLPPNLLDTIQSMATESRHWEVQDFDWVREGPSPNWRKIGHGTTVDSYRNIENELVEALCQADDSRLGEGDVKEVINRVIGLSRSL